MRANGLALQVCFTIGPHDNPHSRHDKPQIPVRNTEVSRKEVTGLGLTSTESSICICRKGQVTLRPASGAESLDFNMLFLDICCLSLVVTPGALGPCRPRTWSRKPRWLPTWQQGLWHQQRPLGHLCPSSPVQHLHLSRNPMNSALTKYK